MARARLVQHMQVGGQFRTASVEIGCGVAGVESTHIRWLWGPKQSGMGGVGEGPHASRQAIEDRGERTGNEVRR
jgi:hypothetical protein